jgi:pimeloyl-ACP methyl ester carboxylesterase
MKYTWILSVVCLLLTGFVQAQDAAVKDTVPYGHNAATGHYLSTRGFKLYYEIYGSGAPMLIIHGNGGSINNFTNQIPYFARNYQVVIADSRAQGKSVDLGDSLSYEMMTDDLNALLDTLHLDSCYIIGWSDGGINGLLMAIRHPDKVRKLAVTGANLWPDTTAVDPYVYHYVMNYNVALRKKDSVPAVHQQLKLLHLLSFEPHITLEQLHTIQCPTLVIGGDHDVILPAHTMLIAHNIPKSDLWILPNSGHSTPIYYKDDFNRVVGNFFAKPYRIIKGFGVFQ